MTKIVNYNFTNQVYNSDSAIAKIAKYSLIGLALLAIVETIKNVVLCTFNLIADSCNLTKKDQKSEEKATDSKIPAKSWTFFVGKYSGLSNIKDGVKNLIAHQWKKGAADLLKGSAKALLMAGSIYAIIATANNLKVAAEMDSFWHERGQCNGKLSREEAMNSCEAFVSKGITKKNVPPLDPSRDFFIRMNNCECQTILTRCGLKKYPIGDKKIWFTTSDKVRGMLSDGNWAEAEGGIANTFHSMNCNGTE